MRLWIINIHKQLNKDIVTTCSEHHIPSRPLKSCYNVHRCRYMSNAIMMSHRWKKRNIKKKKNKKQTIKYIKPCRGVKLDAVTCQLTGKLP